MPPPPYPPRHPGWLATLFYRSLQLRKTAFYDVSKSGMHGQKFHLTKHYDEGVREFANVGTVDTTHSERKHKDIKKEFCNTTKRKTTAEREVTDRMELSGRVEAIHRIHDLSTNKEEKEDKKREAAIDPQNNKPRLVFVGKYRV